MSAPIKSAHINIFVATTHKAEGIWPTPSSLQFLSAGLALAFVLVAVHATGRAADRIGILSHYELGAAALLTYAFARIRDITAFYAFPHAVCF
jgi:hypothetical protein